MAVMGTTPIDSSERLVHKLSGIKVRLDRCTASLRALNGAVVTAVTIACEKGLDLLPIGFSARRARAKTRIGLHLTGTHEQD